MSEIKLSDFNYDLPTELIATSPTERRDESRLLVLDKKNGIRDNFFKKLVDYFHFGDVLVLNNSKVFPARLIGQKETGGKAEVLLNYETNEGWLALGRGLGSGQKIYFKGSKLVGNIIKKLDKEILISFNLAGNNFFAELEKIGKIPLPPYIEKNRKKDNLCDDKKRYQTIYAKNLGSCAAPTAGLHFTEELLKALRKKGVIICELTLHVGLGTFLPIETEDIKHHKMHREYYFVTKSVSEQIKLAKENKKKVFAVGTTTTRVLETVFSDGNYKKDSDDIAGWTDIFIYPGYKFFCVDAMITNFHLPKSSLLLLVSAFAGKEKIFQAYKHAIAKKYRFYSYGDAMLII